MWSRGTEHLRQRGPSRFTAMGAALLGLLVLGGAPRIEAQAPNANPDANANAREGFQYVFEGRLTRMDSGLAPILREGLVFSGYFTLDTSIEAKDEDDALDKARYAGAVSNGEFIFDLNHVIATDGAWRDDTSWITLQWGEPDKPDSRDAYGLTLPMGGDAFGEAGYEPRWLQLWLMGASGKFLPDLRLQIPPDDVEQAWFRVIFVAKDGTQAVAEGPIEWVGPEGEELSPTEQIAQLQGVVTELSDRLDRAEREATHLRTELHKADERIRGLNQTLDAMLLERQALKEDLARAEAQAQPTEEWESRIAALEAEKAMIEESREALGTINEQLAKNLREREGELSAARQEIERLEAKIEADDEGQSILKRPVPDSPHPYLAPGQVRVGPVVETREPLEPAGPMRESEARSETPPEMSPPEMTDLPRIVPRPRENEEEPETTTTDALPRPRKFRGRH